jgi:CDP-alcohol phosphatidyltransferase
MMSKAPPKDAGLKATNILLSPQELDNLTNGTYRYKCVNDSLIEPLLIPFWNGLLGSVPRWVHPNVLTLFGSLSIMPSFFLFAFFSWDYEENSPGWVIALGIIGVLLFQTLDNLDGRQARRLNLSSPIGDWFDHSLDILSMYLLLSQVGTVAFVGHSAYPYASVIGQMSPAVTHYFTFWDRKVSHLLVTPM